MRWNARITANTCAVLIEPIQGEGGVNVPPDGYLQRVRSLCRERDVLFVADEVQTGFGRTGDMFACDHEGVSPDVLIVGKALGGGYYPVSATLASDELMRLFEPGDHGSTFGGNPLASAVADAALDVIVSEDLAGARAARGRRNRAWTASDRLAVDREDSRPRLADRHRADGCRRTALAKRCSSAASPPRIRTATSCGSLRRSSSTTTPLLTSSSASRTPSEPSTAALDTPPAGRDMVGEPKQRLVPLTGCPRAIRSSLEELSAGSTVGLLRQRLFHLEMNT